jgi:hypothetical protein
MFFMIHAEVAQFGLADYEFTFFEYVMMFFFVAGIITAVQRGLKARSEYWQRLRAHMGLHYSIAKDKKN